MDGKTGGIGIFGTVGVVFTVLKLCGLVSWSWWWVLAPFWVPFSLALIVLLVFQIAEGLAEHKRFKAEMERPIDEVPR